MGASAVFGCSGGTRAPRVSKRRWRWRPEPRGAAAPLAELCQDLVEQGSRGVELAPDGGVLDAIQQRDDILPPRQVPLAKRRRDLPDGLRGEQETAARVVQDLAGDLELAASPADDRIAGMRL